MNTWKYGELRRDQVFSSSFFLFKYFVFVFCFKSNLSPPTSQKQSICEIAKWRGVKAHVPLPLY
jgi:hypothetical protein